jgi:predicted LPLAT superfamily acyltransferase
MPEHEDWRGNTGGATWMHQLLIVTFRYIGLRPIYLFMGLFVVPFYMLFNHKGYLSIYHYFRRQHEFSPVKSFWYTYLNHYRFGQIILDRFAVYAGCKYEFELDGNDQFLELTEKPEGFIILSCHVGNYEIAGYTFTSVGKKYNALVFSGEAKTVMENRNRLLSAHNIRMIQVSEDMSHIFEMSNALANGEIVSIPGDRIFGSPKYLACNLFKGKVHLPLGPYTMAIQRGIPAVAIFVMKHALYKYKVYIRKLDTEGTEGLKRNEKVQHLADAFAKELEIILKLYPEQWFNYFEFWHDDRNRIAED